MNIFTDDEAWIASYFELGIYYKHLDIEKKCLIFEALLKHAGIDGYFLYRDQEPSAQQKIEIRTLEFERCVFATIPVKNDTMPISINTIYLTEESQFWLDISIPIGSLQRVFNMGGYPFGGTPEQHPKNWLPEVFSIFENFASVVYESLPFQYAEIGNEIDMEFRSESSIQNERVGGFYFQKHDGLIYYPPTFLDHHAKSS